MNDMIRFWTSVCCTVKTGTILNFRPKSVPNSPSIPRAFSNLRHQLSSAWSSSSKKKQQSSSTGGQSLSGEDKKKWPSSNDCACKLHITVENVIIGTASSEVAYFSQLYYC